MPRATLSGPTETLAASSDQQPIRSSETVCCCPLRTEMARSASVIDSTPIRVILMCVIRSSVRRRLGVFHHLAMLTLVQDVAHVQVLHGKLLCHHWHGSGPQDRSIAGFAGVGLVGCITTSAPCGVGSVGAVQVSLRLPLRAAFPFAFAPRLAPWSGP